MLVAKRFFTFYTYGTTMLKLSSDFEEKDVST